MKYLLALTLVLLALSGCSSSIPESSLSQSSSSTGAVPPPNPNPGAAALATCNQFTSSATAGKVKSIRTCDAFGVCTTNTSSVKLRLSQIPVGFENSDTTYLEFYVWGITPGGQTVCSNSSDCGANWHPVRFRLENRSTGQPACPQGGGSCFFGWNPNNNTNVGFNRQAIYSISGTSQASRILDYDFVVTGTDVDSNPNTAPIYQVLRVVVRDSASSYYSQIDSLLPDFTANPNTYAQGHHDTLDVIHPLWPYRTYGYSDNQFQAMTNAYCF